MTQTLTTSRSLSRGWIELASMLADAPARRRPAFALTEPMTFRSECFAEDLDESTDPDTGADPGAVRNK